MPSHRKFVRLAFEKLYPLSNKDVVVDLGSGDGVVLRIAAEKAGSAIGYELNPALVFISRILARNNQKIEIRLGDMWLVDLPEETTLIYAFTVTRDRAKLERKLQQSVNQWGHSVSVITYGSPLKNKKPLRVLYAHTLYLFEPEM
ncbi:MAG: class I SAM-dependent methyltransferase [Candidatus Saccharimonadales bacterium]